MPALLLPNEILSMSAQAARRLVEAGEGDCALLYLALLDAGEVEKARKALHWEDGRLNAAYSRLAELELVAADTAPAPAKQEPAEEPPQYSRKDVADALAREPDFMGLYHETERLLGRPLSDADLQSLYAIYDGMALPAEVILLLVTYVIRAVRRRTGKAGAVPRMSQIKSEASRWKRLGLETAEAADGYIRRQELVNSREWAILSAVGVDKPRAAVADERRFIASWVELDFSDELISLAYERTVFQKGSMNWSYMNKILLNWHQAGFRTPEQVKAGDKPAKQSAPKAARKQADYQPTTERIQKSADWLDEFLKQQGKEG